MSLPSIWRGKFSDGQQLIVVNADTVDSGRAGEYSDFAMDTLNLTSCKNLCSDWPFQAILRMDEVLCQLNSSLQKGQIKARAKQKHGTTEARAKQKQVPKRQKSQRKQGPNRSKGQTEARAKHRAHQDGFCSRAFV